MSVDPLDELEAAIAGLEDLAAASPLRWHNNSSDEDDDIPPPPPLETDPSSSVPRGSPLLPPPPLQNQQYQQQQEVEAAPPKATMPRVFTEFNLNTMMVAAHDPAAKEAEAGNLYEGAGGSSARPAFSPMNTHYVPYTALVAQNMTVVKPSTPLPTPPTTDRMPAAPKRIIEVVTSDGSLGKKLEVTDDMTVMELLTKFASKARLEDSGYFSLGVPERGYFRWINLNATLRSQNVPAKVVFKLQFLKTPKVFRDPIAIQFYWIQINEMILSGLYPVSDYLVVKLAALNLQARYGNHDPIVHKLGFFQISGNELKYFLPNQHLQKYKPEYWERRILAQHARYLGMDELTARLEYIRVAKKSPSYGATLFEVMSGAHALIGCAEDGILLSRLKNSKCGDWTFYPFEKVQGFRKSGFGLEVTTLEQNRQMQTIKVGLQDNIADAAFDCISDYYALYKMSIDPNYVPPTDRFLPPLTAYEETARRTLLADFPSRLELFKECYIKAAQAGNSRPLLFVLEQIDFSLDLSRDCEVLNFNNANLDVESWQYIRNALLETFSFKPTGSQVFVENFNCKTLKMAQNPRLGVDSFLQLVPVFAAGFSITHLDLSANGIEDEKACKTLSDIIIQSKNLQTIMLKDNRFGTKNSVHILRAVKDNAAIRVLDVTGCELKDQFCFPLALVVAKHPSLQEIDVSHNPIGDEGLLKLCEGMKRSKNMTKINLGGTKVRSHSVKPLIEVASTIGRLKSLILFNTKLSEKTSVKLATLLAQRGPAGILKTLDVQQCSLTKKGTLAIFHALETNQTLETLIIGGNEIDRAGLVALAKGIRGNTTLKTLGLKGLALTSECYVEISNVIRGTQSLTEVDLSDNTMGPADLKKMADAIVLNRTLTTLNLSMNPKITVDGFSAFLTPFANNANVILNRLFFDGCNLGDEGAKRAGEMLRKNSSIERFSLRENGITNEGAAAIFKGIASNITLLHLNIEKNDITWQSDPKLYELKNSVSKGGRVIMAESRSGK